MQSRSMASLDSSVCAPPARVAHSGPALSALTPQSVLAVPLTLPLRFHSPSSPGQTLVVPECLNVQYSESKGDPSQPLATITHVGVSMADYLWRWT